MTDLLSEITFCDECPYSGEPNGCNRKEGVCKAHESYFDLAEENADLRERLERAVELPVLLETPVLKVWKNRVPEDDTRMSFVDMWEITVVNFKLEHYPLWSKFYFPNTKEGKEAAEARLAELKGGKYENF